MGSWETVLITGPYLRKYDCVHKRTRLLSARLHFSFHAFLCEFNLNYNYFILRISSKICLASQNVSHINSHQYTYTNLDNKQTINKKIIYIVCIYNI